MLDHQRITHQNVGMKEIFYVQIHESEVFEALVAINYYKALSMKLELFSIDFVSHTKFIICMLKLS